jgi:hypothetical protein
MSNNFLKDFFDEIERVEIQTSSYGGVTYEKDKGLKFRPNTESLGRKIPINIEDKKNKD